ncbi:MAG: hypothetical protein MJ236_02815 [Clostridia bacterium]|nr:hypothetical protein [Clostridia bacterium]
MNEKEKELILVSFFMTINDSKKENLTPEELEKTSGGYCPSTTPNKFELAAGTIA